MPDPGLSINEIHHRAVVRLKSWAPASGPAPDEGSPSQAVFSGEARLLSLGPGEWLAVSDLVDGPTLRLNLLRHVAGTAAVDLTCGIKTLEVSGPVARELLAKGCALDLHPKSFPTGRSTRTRFAQLSVIVDCTDPAPRFELHVARSYLAWLQSWLTDAAAEFQPQG